MKKLILFLLLASPAFGGIAFVNSNQKVGGTTGTNGSGSLSMTAGNIELVFASFYDGALHNPHVTGISDTAGDASYTFLGRFAFNDTNCNGTGNPTPVTACVLTEVWYTTIASTNATATITVTTTPTGTGTSVALHFDQYSCLTGCRVHGQHLERSTRRGSDERRRQQWNPNYHYQRR